ncbi:MAG: ketopantoate reductase family protein [Candidatus Lokiarchaeota archaeon]|nr:ketopantoate reductase family protein [Candidatus Lokiarchaeota archaeon]
MKILIYGVGAIGGTIGGLLAKNYKDLYLLARGENADILEINGLTLYKKIKKTKQIIPVNIVRDLNEISNIDLIIITVKNYDLEEVTKDIKTKLENEPIIVTFQNGIENQKILSKYFSKVVYGVISISAWRDEPGIFGYQKERKLLIGTLDNSLREEMKIIKKIIQLSIPIEITQMIQDVIHTKLLFNLTSSVLTLFDYKNHSNNTLSYVRRIITKLMIEGIEIVEAAGFKEQKIEGITSWKDIKKADNIPNKIVDTIFKKRLKKTGPNSMYQDIIINKRGVSELEFLNGYLIQLSKRYNLQSPFNNAFYKICKKEFIKIPFKPLEPEFVWNTLNSLKSMMS